jgi:hypothetical protein
MILFAYAIALLAVAWALAARGRPWILGLDEERQQRIRLAGMAIAVLVGVAGVAVVWVQATGEAADQEVLPWAIGAALIVGGVVYGAGLLAWRGPRALALRLAGWALMTLAFGVPSTLTLALPLVALLVPTLALVPASPGAGSAGSVHDAPDAS